MPHPSIETLVEQLRAAREAGPPGKPSPEKVKLLRELIAACPASTPGTLALARALLVTEEPGVGVEEAFAEIQRLLERAIQVSDRSAPALIELAYFIDTFRESPERARKLFEEGAAQALESLEDAWAGLLSLLTAEEKWPEALALAERAEPLFPDSVRIIDAVERARELAARAAKPPPSSP
jgi:tetratricopeptide (TPR) repeat protein